MNLRLVINFFIAIFILPISVSMASQEVVLTKQVDKPSTKPGEIVTYYITYQNPGTQTLTEVTIIDVIPTNTIFQEAFGTNTTIYYCHDNSSNFDTSSSPPVNKVKWLLGNSVEAEEIGTVTLRLKVK